MSLRCADGKEFAKPASGDVCTACGKVAWQHSTRSDWRRDEVIQEFCDAVERAEKYRESRGPGGQQVSYHGDFASAPPSTLGELKRWARRFKEST